MQARAYIKETEGYLILTDVKLLTSSKKKNLIELYVQQTWSTFK